MSNINDDDMVMVFVGDWREILKTLAWVRDNPGIHPENIRNELLRLGEKHLQDVPPAPREDHGTFVLSTDDPESPWVAAAERMRRG